MGEACPEWDPESLKVLVWAWEGTVEDDGEWFTLKAGCGGHVLAAGCIPPTPWSLNCRA